MDKLEVSKPRKSVEVVNTISLVQRKAFNGLIMKYMLTPKPKGEKYHSISIQDLCHLTGYRQKDFVYLDEQLREMQTTLIEWSDSSKKGRVGFLGHVEYNTATGMLEYSFHEKMIDLIRQRKIFNRVDIGSMRELTSKYSLALYEFCTGYRETPTFKEGTGWRVLKDMKLLLCGDAGVYPQFKEFNKFVLKPSIKEVNEQTDIQVEMETQKRGRSIYAVRFWVKGNENYEDILLEKPRDEVHTKLALNDNKPEVEQVPEEDLLGEMQLSGDAFSEAWKSADKELEQARREQEEEARYQASEEALQKQVAEFVAKHGHYPGQS